MPDQSINLFILTLYGSVFFERKKKGDMCNTLKGKPLDYIKLQIKGNARNVTEILMKTNKKK